MPIKDVQTTNKQHAVPQNIMDVEFKIIGELTLRQFAYLIVFGGIGYIAAVYMQGIFKWPVVVVCALVGVGLAFVPIQERGMDQWIVNFFLAVYTPNQKVWKKDVVTPAVFLYQNMAVVKQELITLAPTSSRRKLEEFLEHKDFEKKQDRLDIPEEKYIKMAKDAFVEDVKHAKAPAQTSSVPFYAPVIAPSHVVTSPKTITEPIKEKLEKVIPSFVPMPPVEKVPEKKQEEKISQPQPAPILPVQPRPAPQPIPQIQQQPAPKPLPQTPTEAASDSSPKKVFTPFSLNLPNKSPQPQEVVPPVQPNPVPQTMPQPAPASTPIIKSSFTPTPVSRTYRSVEETPKQTPQPPQPVKVEPVIDIIQKSFKPAPIETVIPEAPKEAPKPEPMIEKKVEPNYFEKPAIESVQQIPTPPIQAAPAPTPAPITTPAPKPTPAPVINTEPIPAPISEPVSQAVPQPSPAPQPEPVYQTPEPKPEPAPIPQPVPQETLRVSVQQPIPPRPQPEPELKITKARIRLTEDMYHQNQGRGNDIYLAPITPDRHSGRRFTSLLPKQGEIVLPIRGERVIKTSEEANVDLELKEKTEELNMLIHQIKSSGNYKKLVKQEEIPVPQQPKQQKEEKEKIITQAPKPEEILVKPQQPIIPTQPLKPQLPLAPHPAPKHTTKVLPVSEPEPEPAKPGKSTEEKAKLEAQINKLKEEIEKTRRQKEVLQSMPVFTQPTPAPAPQGAIKPQFSSQMANISNKPNVVSGVVRNAARVGLEGIVIIVRNDRGETVRAIKTNSLGEFSLATPLANGTYTLEVDQFHKSGLFFDIISLQVKGEIIPPIEFVGRV